jgi:hypothetical protein
MPYATVPCTMPEGKAGEIWTARLSRARAFTMPGVGLGDQQGGRRPADWPS